MQFTLTIKLGNAAMSDHADVAHALRKVADLVDAGAGDGSIRDPNGNTVGRFAYTGE